MQDCLGEPVYDLHPGHPAANPYNLICLAPLPALRQTIIGASASTLALHPPRCRGPSRAACGGSRQRARSTARRRASRACTRTTTRASSLTRRGSRVRTISRECNRRTRWRTRVRTRCMRTPLGRRGCARPRRRCRLPVSAAERSTTYRCRCRPLPHIRLLRG